MDDEELEEELSRSMALLRDIKSKMGNRMPSMEELAKEVFAPMNKELSSVDEYREEILSWLHGMKLKSFEYAKFKVYSCDDMEALETCLRQLREVNTFSLDGYDG